MHLGNRDVSESCASLAWADGLAGDRWDAALAALGGHPLQSSLWGDARRAVDGIRDHRWMARRGAEVVWMVRFEERRIPGVGRVAWAPRGPTGATPSVLKEVHRDFMGRLKRSGFILAVTDPWFAAEATSSQSRKGPVKPHTIWIDLGQGKDVLWKNFHTQMRKGVRRAARGGVVVDQTRTREDVGRFFALCRGISEAKGFRLPGSLPLMERLLRDGEQNEVEGRLFVARHEGRLAAGLFILRCGRSVHQIWGASDRDLSQQRVGEAVQWAVMEWAIEQGCQLYDLEGIDPVNNPGVYGFKKKMGGEEVTLAGKQFYPLCRRGRVAAWLGTRRF